MSKVLKYWGWGYENMPINPTTFEQLTYFIKSAFEIEQFERLEPIPIEQLDLRAPRFNLSTDLIDICSASTFDRARHSYGKSFRDIWRGLHGQFPNPPDYVAFPKSEKDIKKLMRFATNQNIALVPFGGGSSVVGGVEGTTDNRYQGFITVDMKHFNQILEVDKVSRCAHIQAGIFGPALEKGLKKEGLTLRHFPQSFEFSTLGGWIVTRSGGHFATLHTHIDEFVQNVRMVTPKGIMESRRLPGHGAGPSEERLITGSEGIFGIVTSAWMRVLKIPKYKATQTVNFAEFGQAVEAARSIAQSDLYPSNARLVDPMEAYNNGLGNGRSTVLILGFESHHHDVTHSMQAALKFCETYGGQWEQKDPNQKRNKKADVWKDAFLQAPYMRDELVKLGLIVETFETATTWTNFPTFHKNIKKAVMAAIQEHCEGKGFITCRFTHLYPDGPAPYYTVMAKGKTGLQLKQWDAIKKAASDAIIANSGTITHHHAVGRDHAAHYAKQRTEIFGSVLEAAKLRLDPEWVMNPGVLLEERSKE